MKLRTSLLDSLRLTVRKHSSIQPWHIYSLELLAGLGGMIALWYKVNPLLAIAYYLIATRLIQYSFYKRQVKDGLASFRIVMNGLAGIVVTCMSLLYSLQFTERIAHLIKPAHDSNDVAFIFTFCVLLGLAVLCEIVVIVEVNRKLKTNKISAIHTESISDKLFGSLVRKGESLLTLGKRSVNSFTQVNRKSYTQLSLKEKIYICLRVLVFPLGILASYFLGRTEYVVCAENSCAGSRGSGKVQTVLVISFMLLILVVSLLRDRPNNHRALSRFVSWQVVTSLLSFLATITVYQLLYPYSQSGGRESVVVTPQNQVVIEHRALFGIALPYGMILFLSLFYLCLPLIRWYRVLVSQRYIDGMKKHELFQ